MAFCFYKISTPIFWGLIIIISFLAFGSVPNPSLDISIGDKINHFSAFAVLWLFGYFKYGKLNEFNFFIYLFLYGVVIEAVQYFLPNHEASFLDIFADSFGIFIGFLLTKYIIYLK
jgi:VanZ family protein